MKLLAALLCVAPIQACLAQFAVIPLDKHSIPKAITYTGHIVDAVRWTDSLGDNIVITTETGATPGKGKEEGNRDAALYVYHYLNQADSFQLTWKIYDFVKDCPVDINANFTKGTFAITDLNNDGKAEVWVMYKTACRGDVSPANLKIIMYENNKKYAVRGSTKVKPAENEVDGGDYTLDDAFRNAPEPFRQYALQLWKKNMVETWQ